MVTIKVIGFKVGVKKPTFNRTLSIPEPLDEHVYPHYHIKIPLCPECMDEMDYIR